MPMRIRRTESSGPPTLEDGQLGIEQATPGAPRLWIGVQASVDPTGRRLVADQAASLPLADLPLNVARGGTGATSLPLVPVQGQTLSSLLTGNGTNPVAASAFVGTWGDGSLVLFQNGYASYIQGFSCNGTLAAPTATVSDNELLSISGRGRAPSGWTTPRATITMSAAQAWTDAAQGSQINFNTTANGTTTSRVAMTLQQNGGLSLPADAAAKMDLVDGGLFLERADSSPTGYSGYVSLRRTRGTKAAPTAVMNNDPLAEYNCFGYRPNGYASGAGIIMRATQNWTNTANGCQIEFSLNRNDTPGNTITSGAGSTRVLVLRQDGGLELEGDPDSSQYIIDGGMFSARYDSAPTGYSGYLSLRRARGTKTAPTAVAADDSIGEITAFGYRPNGFAFGTGIFTKANQAWTNAANGARLEFTVIADNTTGGIPGGTNPNAVIPMMVRSDWVRIGGRDQAGNPPFTYRVGLGVSDYLQVGALAGGAYSVYIGNDGQAWFNGAVNAPNIPSDRRLKKNIAEFTRGLDVVRQMQPVSFQWENDNTDGVQRDSDTHYSLIADELMKSLPEAVSEVVRPEAARMPGARLAAEPIKRFDDRTVMMALINAVKELDAKVTQLSTTPRRLAR